MKAQGAAERSVKIVAITGVVTVSITGTVTITSTDNFCEKIYLVWLVL